MLVAEGMAAEQGHLRPGLRRPEPSSPAVVSTRFAGVPAFLKKLQDRGVTLQQLEQHIDRDGDGKVSPRDFQRGLQKLGIYGTKGDFSKVYDVLNGSDRSAHASVRTTELAARFFEQELLDKGVSLAMLKTVVDPDGDGEVTLHDFQYGLQQLGLVKSREECRAYLANFDMDGDGVISMAELMRSKAEGDYNLIIKALAGNALMAPLPRRVLRDMAGQMRKIEVRKEDDHRVITQGDTLARAFYVVDTGDVSFVADGKEVYRAAPGRGTAFWRARAAERRPARGRLHRRVGHRRALAARPRRLQSGPPRGDRAAAAAAAAAARGQVLRAARAAAEPTHPRHGGRAPLLCGAATHGQGPA